MTVEDILRKNIRDLQEQLQTCYIRNKQIMACNLQKSERIHKLEKLLDKERINHEGLSTWVKCS